MKKEWRFLEKEAGGLWLLDQFRAPEVQWRSVRRQRCKAGGRGERTLVLCDCFHVLEHASPAAAFFRTFWKGGKVKLAA